MKNLLFLILVLVLSDVKSQTSSIPRLEKISIPDCGCSVYMPKGTAPFSKEYSKDSSLVFTADYVTEDDFSFSAIAVKFKESLGKDKATNEEMLIMYMDFIKSQLTITGSAGYGKGHTMEKYPDAVGIIDYWEDAAGYQFAVKGWIDGEKLAILYIAGKSEYPYFNLQQMFFGGFGFD